MPREKVRQLHLPDMEPESIPELEDAIQEYVNARDTRVKWSSDEEAKQDALKELMDKHKLKTYTTSDGRLVEVVTGPGRVKVRKPKAEEEDTDDEL